MYLYLFYICCMYMGQSLCRCNLDSLVLYTLANTRTSRECISRAALYDYVRKICIVVSGGNNNKPGGYTTYTGYDLLPVLYTEWAH